MKTGKSIFLFSIVLFVNATNGFAADTKNDIFSLSDSSITPVNTIKADSVIEKVAQSNVLPQQQKVQYVSQVTKYGFKDLFSNYTYNPDMPYNVQVNPNAEQFIQDYVKSHGTYLAKMKEWGIPYFNLIENILKQYGLPGELKYIAVIESGLQSGATSGKGACGPWQLMPETARRLGLTINNYTDERTDYCKSTNAAARYLLSLYGQFNDWLLVMAAYNGGTQTVLNAMQKSNSKNFWDLQFYLPEESRIYVKRFIATHYIMEGASNYPDSTNNLTNSKMAPSAKQADIKELAVSGRYNSIIIAKNISMDIVSFNQYNPGFDETMATNGNCTMRLPNDKMQLFVANKYKILNESVNLLLSNVTIPDSKTICPKKNTPEKNAKQL